MMFRRALSIAACSLLLVSAGFTSAHAQMGGMEMKDDPSKPLPSPAATANVTLAGGTVTIHYNTPHMRGRQIMGGLVPYGQVWRTGANPATTLITPISLHIGNLLVPAGTYTIYTLPSPKQWMLIINKQTGQWGTEYHEDKDLGRVPMKEKSISTPQEVMSISFEDTKDKETELHIKWEKTDVSVKVTTP